MGALLSIRRAHGTQRTFTRTLHEKQFGGNRGRAECAYDHNGDPFGQVDFKNHGGCAGSGHAHLIHPPGSAASVAAAQGPGAPHIPPADVPAEWKAIPPGMKPATPIGQ